MRIPALYKYPKEEDQKSNCIIYSNYLYKLVDNDDCLKLKQVGIHMYLDDIDEFIFIPNQEEICESGLFPYYIVDKVQVTEDEDTIYTMISSPFPKNLDKESWEMMNNVAQQFIDGTFTYCKYCYE